MTILISSNTNLIVQGITGREGTFHSESMKKYGTKIIGGVRAGKGGSQIGSIRVYDSVEEVVAEHPEVNTSIIFVPAPNAADAVFEAIDSGIKLIVIITEHIPVHDTIRFIEYGKLKGVKIVGPNCPGIISPPVCKVGIMPSHFYSEGNIGIVSRSGTLNYEVARYLTNEGLGQSTVVGIGGDYVTGLNFTEVIEMFNDDKKTKGIVVLGEIGGNDEEKLAEHVKKNGLKKPIIAFIAGKTAPPGKRMGHAGAVINMGEGGAQVKIDALTKAGVMVAKLPSQIPELMKSLL